MILYSGSSIVLPEPPCETAFTHLNRFNSPSTGTRLNPVNEGGLHSGYLTILSQTKGCTISFVSFHVLEFIDLFAQYSPGVRYLDP